MANRIGRKFTQVKGAHLGLLCALDVGAGRVEVPTEGVNDLEQLMRLHRRVTALAEVLEELFELLPR